jgi:serine/threonine-protein kinase
VTPRTRELLARLRPLLEQGLDLPPAERRDWLERLRMEHPALAPEVEALLEEEAGLEARRFLEGKLPGDLLPGDAPVAGLAVGAYMLEQPIGQGGMGTVWLARRTDGVRGPDGSSC